jgi:four helix bundle protein
MASGSTNELEYHFILAKDLGYLNSDLHDQLESKVIELRKMLSSLINKVTEQRFAK